MRLIATITLIAALAVMSRAGTTSASSTDGEQARIPWAGLYSPVASPAAPEGVLVAIGDVNVSQASRIN